MSSETITKNDLKAIFDKILPFDKLFYFTTVTDSGYGFTANQSRTGLTRSYTPKDGYKAIVYHSNCSTHANIDLYYAVISTEGTITFSAVNRASSAYTNVGFAFRLLFINESVIGQ